MNHYQLRPGKFGSGRRQHLTIGATVTGALLMASLGPGAHASDCVDDAKWSTVAHYYDINKSKSNRNYGANWYRVLITYRQEDPERTLPAWEGSTAQPTAPYTVKEAENGEKAWSGWTPVRKVLECLKRQRERVAPPLPDASAPSVSVGVIPAGDEGTSVKLTSVLAGGAYDIAAYAWTASGGTLDDATLPEPTWTRPQVDADGLFTVGLSVVASGDGTVAKAGTSATSNTATVFVQVRDSPPRRRSSRRIRVHRRTSRWC